MVANPNLDRGMGARPSGILLVYQRGLRGDAPRGRRNMGFERNVARNLVHEGLHRPGPDVQLPMSMAGDPWEELHQEPFNEAAEDLLGY